MNVPAAQGTAFIQRTTAGTLRSDNEAGVLWCMRQYFGGLWKGLFFLSAAAVMTSGILGLIGAVELFLSPFSMCNQVFLIVFGFVMIVIDFPADMGGLMELKFSIWRYCLFMTRFTGRGIWYLYLATLVWASLYNLNIEPFLGFVLGGFVGAVGILSIFYGVQKSLKLERCRSACANLGLDNWSKLVPKRGLTLPEFNDIMRRVADTDFSVEELELIAAALSVNVRSDDIISEEEFRTWILGRMTIM